MSDLSANLLALATKSLELSNNEVLRLRAAIRNHRDQRGDDRCWIDDEMLYGSLDEPLPLDISALPPKEDFLKSCERYYEQRRCPLDAYPPGKMRLAELEAEVERLRAENECLKNTGDL